MQWLRGASIFYLVNRDHKKDPCYKECIKHIAKTNDYAGFKYNKPNGEPYEYPLRISQMVIELLPFKQWDLKSYKKKHPEYIESLRHGKLREQIE